jgi:protein tyrosine phosphatase
MFWPDEGQPRLTFNDRGIVVRLVAAKLLLRHDIVQRTVEVATGGTTHTASMVHYRTWPDHDAPQSIRHMDALMHAAAPLDGGPTVVHCSAGIGRTGTYIAIAAILSMWRTGPCADPAACPPRALMPPAAEDQPPARGAHATSRLGAMRHSLHGFVHGESDLDAPEPIGAGDSSPWLVRPMSTVLGDDPVLRVILALRDQRRGVVQSRSQLAFIYAYLLHRLGA